ncbi:asparagine synthase-related protein [Novosphingobium ginsenosidimutans]|uniref:asparagine synthase (glutamine-hydrolyzing) n=1 Tax=Novosphingobium ginsenosidimutans TaxID=1176536 RepID=A0A5B8S2G3_9SPHN|nr:asparagine synthase-related protein [Novosphingobium ginsenosidimutans]QEA15540.1 hypothetical protein FRF71_04975 [Novosphingobium ginsenosidimutans]
MIAVDWQRSGRHEPTAAHLAQALAAGTGRIASAASVDQCQVASLLPGTASHRARQWQPPKVGPLLVLFAGRIDNAREAAGLLEVDYPGDRPDPAKLARLYGAARLAWGDAADLRLIGEYAAILINGAAQELCLVRSPLRAPPLHFHARPERLIAASVTRALFACGVPRQINDAKLADNALFNPGDDRTGWFEGVEQVPLGTELRFNPAGMRERRYYDLYSLPKVRLGRDAEYLEAAHSLLTEATKVALRGSHRPAIMLSGGLDSSQVAAKALAALPAGSQLHAFTFTPENGWDGHQDSGTFGDERPYVEAFAQQHPGLVLHFEDNAGTGFDAGLTELFFATGSAAINQTNFSHFHSLWRAARAAGCDVVLGADYGNFTFSAEGGWGFPEYLLRGRWRQLWLALRHAENDDRSLLRRFLALSVLPILPDKLWQWQRRLRGQPDIFAIASPLRADYALSSGAQARARQAGQPVRRWPELGRWREFELFQRNDHCDIMHGFEEIYGLPQRDPTAWRPFVEFCLGLPTELFLRDGQTRWLAREMARGIMPEAQRLETRHGRHGADWHLKLGRRRRELLAEVEQLAQNERLSAMIDFPKIRHALEDWPATGAIPVEERLLREGAIPRAIMLARYVNYFEGCNQ